MPQPADSEPKPIRDEPLRQWEKAILIALALVVIGFGCLVEIRSAYLSTRKTDLGCYLRAAWAVRTGNDLYAVTDDNGWHYIYPPAFAVLMAPLADAPAGEPRDFMLPYPVAVAIWYLFGVACLFVAIHWIACALEHSGTSVGSPYGRCWWRTRLLPFYICIVPIGTTLSRGQVNLLLVAMIAGMFRSTIEGRPFRSGLWLGSAICLKIVPLFLLVLPLWRRDGKCLFGVAAALVVGVALIPSLVWGPIGAFDHHRQFYQMVLRPGVTGDHSVLDKELMNLDGTDNQSTLAILHKYRHPHPATRPAKASADTKLLSQAIGALLGAVILLRWGRSRDPVAFLLQLGALVMVMTITSPMAHTHYFCFAIPIVMGIAARDPSRLVLGALALTGLLFALVSLPLAGYQREVGFPLIGTALLIGFGLSRGRSTRAGPQKTLPLARAA